MMLLLERDKLLVEGAGAVGLAAVLRGKIQVVGKRVGVVLSGGNVDPHLIARVVEHGLAHAGRYLVFRVMVEDRPGQLSRLLNIVSSTDVNVLGHRASQARRIGALGPSRDTTYVGDQEPSSLYGSKGKTAQSRICASMRANRLAASLRLRTAHQLLALDASLALPSMRWLKPLHPCRVVAS